MIEAYCDGGSRGNPGHSAWGFVIKQNGRIIAEEKAYIGIATNNFAEYTAVIEALTWLKDHYQGSDLIFYLDSKLVAFQLSGLYKIKNANIRSLVVAIKTLEPSFGQIRYHHVPRDQNKQADALVNLALDRHLGSK